MLALSRKEGEVIVIGDEIEVVLLAAENGRAKLGIVAPDDVTIHRKEVRERMAADDKRSREINQRRIAAKLLKAMAANA